MVAPTIVGGPVRVNVTNFSPTGAQYFPHATALADGRVAIAWNTDNGYQAAIMRTDGVSESAAQTFSMSSGSILAANGQVDLAQLSDGRLVAAWITNAVDASNDINWQYLDPFIGYSGPVNAIAIAGANNDISIAGGTYGRFAMVDTGAGTGNDVFRLSFNSLGASIYTSAEITAGVALTGDQSQATIVSLSDGRFFAVWNDLNDGNIKGQFLDGYGGRINTITIGTGARVSGVQDDGIGLTATPDGGFAVAWNDGTSTQYRTFDASGTAKIAQTAITGLSFAAPAITALQDGRLIVAGAGSGIRGQMITAAGALDGGLFTISATGNSQVDLVTLADGRIVATYSESGVTGGNSRDIMMEVLDPRLIGLNGVSASNSDDTWYGTAFADFVMMGAGDDTFNAGAGVDFIYGGEGSDTLNGGDGGDTLLGDNGNDTLNGDAGDDALHGGFGADALNGGDGDDILYGGDGADVLNGGNNFDYASYLTATAGVTADLTTPSNNVGDAKGDTYTGIEGLIGTTFADTLKGDAGNNWIYGGGSSNGVDSLYGLAGNDVLIGDANGNDDFYGGEGADAMYGGSGTADWARYDFAAAGVIADLASPIGNTGEAAGDTYNGIEGLIGSAFADTLRGDAGNNTLSGNSGADTLIGRAGNDSLSGGAGNDILNGGAGADALNGGADFDYATYADHLGGLTADLQTIANNTGEAAGDTYTAVEGLIGTGYDDSLRGDAGDNWIYGGNGNDFIYGRDGADTLLGEGGSDTIYGGTGNDAIYGGLGNDTLVYAAGDGKDIFYDFIGGAGASESVLISTATGVTTFAQLQTKMVQVGADVVITFDASNSITLIGTNLGALNSDDFGFY